MVQSQRELAVVIHQIKKLNKEINELEQKLNEKQIKVFKLYEEQQELTLN